jgi:hypothetical protein
MPTIYENRLKVTVNMYSGRVMDDNLNLTCKSMYKVCYDSYYIYGYSGITKENCQDFVPKPNDKIVETSKSDTLFINSGHMTENEDKENKYTTMKNKTQYTYGL